MSDQFEHYEEDRKRMGELYRYTEEKYGDQVTITFLDPRNLFSIMAYFIRQVKRKQIKGIQAMKNFLLYIKLDAIFINGNYLNKQENYDRIIDKYIALSEV